MQIDIILKVFPGDLFFFDNFIINVNFIYFFFNQVFISYYFELNIFVDLFYYLVSLWPEKLFNFISFFSNLDISTNFFFDFYIIFGKGNISEGWFLKFYYKPFISFFFILFFFFLLFIYKLLINFIFKFKKNYLY